MTILDRRNVMLASVGLAGMGLAFPALPAATTRRINLDDPKIALEAYVKLRGSTADETVFQPYEGDIFLAADNAIGIPLCGFKGLQKSVWRRDGDGGFRNTDFDLGFYVDYGTRAILKEWHNPVTGKTVEVFHYRGGPSGGHFKIGGDAGDVYGGTDGRWSIFGDHIWHSAGRWGERPNAMAPEEWPLASSGKMARGSMSITFAGRVSDVANPDVHLAPSFQIWTNLSDWMPWMEMGQRPGCNLWRWVGAKGTDRAALPQDLVAAAEAVWPGYVTADSGWTVPTSGRLDYMQAKRGLPLSR